MNIIETSRRALAPTKRVAWLATVFALGACGSSAGTKREVAEPPDDAPAQPAVEAEDDSSCNIGMTVCWRPGDERLVTVKQSYPPIIEGCAGGEACRYVRIESVDNDDIHWDVRQSLAGVVCSLDADGLRLERAPGYYRGRLVACNDGKSYDFRYVRVHSVRSF